MLVRRSLFVFLAASTAACLGVAGCAADTSDSGGSEAVDDGDGTGDSQTDEDDIVSERQLMGNELPDKTISLTFDDGPGQRTSELADYLAEKGIKATFFINGMKVPGRQAAVDKVVGRGHLLANHTQNHKQLTKLSSTSVVSEISATDAIIEQAQPDAPSVLRAPFGAWNGSVQRAVNGSSSMRKYVGSVFWDIGGELTSTSAADWDCWGKGVSVQRCGDLYLNEIRKRKRGIVLMHDIHNKTVDMVKAIVPVLQAEGYRFAKLEDVPSVKRAIGTVTSGGNTDDGCSSATLGRTVPENVCVQSRANERWFRCVDGEWAASSGAADTRCTERHPL